MYQVSDYDFHLPQEQIAQHPIQQRDQSRLLVLDRHTGSVRHHLFADILQFLSPDDLLVINNTRVIPARLYGHKETGGRVEVLILDYAGGLQQFEQTGAFASPCLIRASRGPRPGTCLQFSPELTGEVIHSRNGIYQVRFQTSESMETLLDRIGHLPLPPYIQRNPETDHPEDRTAYQTVYAQKKGAIAAPTAGLHFSSDLMGRIRQKGTQLIEITLHVGYGTFLPIRVDDLRNHRMHAERYTLSRQAAAAINYQKEKKGRIIAVGTTSVRTLEYATQADGRVKAGSGSCDLFIYPGYSFQTVTGMITNFHLPKSTLIMLVSALAGRKTILTAYQEAVQAGYRFFSYGDAMFIH